jgi:PhnB protein
MAQTMLSPYLNFDGNTKEAMEFYRQVLGGKLTVQNFSEVQGMPIPPGYGDKVMHASLEADGLMIMASDPPPGSKVRFGDNVHLSLMGSDSKRLTNVFNSLATGGKVTMPLAKQFWGDTFGSLTDKFGVHWMVNISEK